MAADAVPIRNVGAPSAPRLPLNWMNVESFCHESLWARLRIHRRYARPACAVNGSSK
jgi:hypothetical protein